MTAKPTAAWPELPRDWAYATLHMWMQMAGKIALAQAPPLNHCWSVSLRLTPRGLTTRPLPHGERTFTLEFDFLAHALVITVSASKRIGFGTSTGIDQMRTGRRIAVSVDISSP